jgi:hypothetical protein
MKKKNRQFPDEFVNKRYNFFSKIIRGIVVYYESMTRELKTRPIYECL